MASKFNISIPRLNCQKMLRNSRKYQRQACYSCEIENKNLKNWIDINKKQFLVRPKTHSRSLSLQQRSCSPINRIQIRFPPEKKKIGQKKTVVGTRCNSAETSSSSGSQQKNEQRQSPHKQVGGRSSKTSRAALFQIISYRSNAKERNEIKGLKQNRFEEIFKRAELEEGRLFIRGRGIL